MYSDGNNKILDIEPGLMILPDSTNNKSEMLAIALAVDYAFQNQKSTSGINIFSDSKVSVYSLTKWIWGWKKKSEGLNHFIKMDGELVNNNVMLIDTLYKISQIDVPVKIYHQKGHCNSTEMCKKFFKESNGVEINDDDAIKLNKYNNFIDTTTRNFLLGHINMFPPDSVYVPIPFTTSKQDIDWRELYRKVIL